MIIRTVLCCLVLVLAFTLLADSALAQSSSADKDLATKEGVAASLGNKEFDQDKLPGKLEVSIAFGSVFVLIAVWKWL
jgi:hypothetical protein